MTEAVTLHFMCGKMGSGKSTFAKSLAASCRAALLSEDDLLRQLYPGGVTDLSGYIELSGRIKNALADHICALLQLGTSVVLDFPGNTLSQRAWFRQLVEKSGARHQLHYLNVPNETCRQQLRERRAANPSDSLQDDATFEALLAYFAPPAEEEQFTVVLHELT